MPDTSDTSATLVNLRIQSEYRNIRTIKNFVFGHFSRSDILQRRVAIIWINRFLIFVKWFKHKKGHWTQDSFFQISSDKEYQFLWLKVNHFWKIKNCKYFYVHEKCINNPKVCIKPTFGYNKTKQHMIICSLDQKMRRHMVPRLKNGP